MRTLACRKERESSSHFTHAHTPECRSHCNVLVPERTGPVLEARRDGESACMLRSPPDHFSDLQLVRDALTGRPDAVESFVQRMRCVPLILAAQNARLGRPLRDSDIQDLEQDTLLAIWKKLATFEGLSTLETWVYRFCSLELLNALRRKRRRQSMESLEDEEHESESAPALGLTAYEHVYRGLERLESTEARVIQLKHFQSLTFEEIAARLDIPTNTAKTKYYRGLRKLHELLRSSGEESA